ncbi:hypothetical protein H112_08079 [Trichophyton rubrum D6]|uniref:Methyltransferase type 12 domain-containing protein n=2 Tax=Trichophyton TaxID=5550 RepID=A0A178FS76_TRIVO|nr:hypothetical protein H104_08037 [Trichophyton rubrum CBS 289.86]EZF69413.1 hypothetical protein H105_08089 [Trichophyton soudanense CBS 452.61]KDB29341.1 hypothetical protein H112_08079 [Trichophyton rubrum D6]OAL74978.1 hypothetical protein A7D00_0576 [Trichophyton violaceum]
MDVKPVAAWDQLAEAWDMLMGTPGNDYYTAVELPALERLVQPKPGDCALDLATGNGLVAHWMAQKGTSVLATDGSPVMLTKAQARQSKRLKENGEAKVSYQILDVTDPQHFEELIQSRGPGAGGAFDIITMNMAIMDVSTLEHLANALPKLLKRDGGRFVATLLHPLFTCGVTRAVEYRDNPESGREEAFHTLKMTKYLDVPSYKGVATQSQPYPQLYFHRPMQEIFAPFFKAGLVLDALEEPNFDEAYVKARDLDIGSLRQFTQFPKILAFRMKIA